MSCYRTIADLEAAEGLIVRGKGPSGRNLCKFCGIEVPTNRRTFCSAACVHEWELRSNINYLKSCLFKIQKGVCQGCGLDTIALGKELKKMPEPLRSQTMIEYGIPLHRSLRRLWDCDHIIPVVFGGGIELDGQPLDIIHFVQTLCIVCHKIKTFEMKDKLKIFRRKSKMIKKATQ